VKKQGWPSISLSVTWQTVGQAYCFLSKRQNISTVTRTNILTAG